MRNRWAAFLFPLAIGACGTAPPAPADLALAQSQIGRTFAGDIMVVALCPAPELPVDTNCPAISPKRLSVLGVAPYRNTVFARVLADNRTGYILFDPISIRELDRSEEARKEKAEFSEDLRYCASAFNRLHIGMLESVANALDSHNHIVCSERFTTTTKYGTHEQWRWDRFGFVYFDNGRLTAIQHRS